MGLSPEEIADYHARFISCNSGFKEPTGLLPSKARLPSPDVMDARNRIEQRLLSSEAACDGETASWSDRARQKDADLRILLTALDQAAEALKPFARLAACFEGCAVEYPAPDTASLTFDWTTRSKEVATIADFRLAATVYATLKPVDTKEGEGA